MSFDIVKTPSLQAVATGDERQLVEDLQGRVDAAVQQAETRSGVMEAARQEAEAE